MNMAKEASLEFRLKKIDGARNDLLEKMKHNDLMSEKYKKTCKCLNYVKHLLVLVSTITGCVSISAYALLVSVLAGITSSAVEIKNCAITAGIKKYKSIIKKRKRKHDKIVLLGKDQLNPIEVLISKALIDSYISPDEFVSVNNVLREYNEKKFCVIYKNTENPLCQL